MVNQFPVIQAKLQPEHPENQHRDWFWQKAVGLLQQFDEDFFQPLVGPRLTKDQIQTSTAPLLATNHQSQTFSQSNSTLTIFFSYLFVYRFKNAGGSDAPKNLIFVISLENKDSCALMSYFDILILTVICNRHGVLLDS